MTTRPSAYEKLRSRAAERIEDRKLDVDGHPKGQTHATVLGRALQQKRVE